MFFVIPENNFNHSFSSASVLGSVSYTEGKKKEKNMINLMQITFAFLKLLEYLKSDRQNQSHSVSMSKPTYKWWPQLTSY